MIRNSLISNEWGNEEREGKIPFEKAVGFDLEIKNEEYAFQVCPLDYFGARERSSSCSVDSDLGERRAIRLVRSSARAPWPERPPDRRWRRDYRHPNPLRSCCCCCAAAARPCSHSPQSPPLYIIALDTYVSQLLPAEFSLRRFNCSPHRNVFCLFVLRICSHIRWIPPVARFHSRLLSICFVRALWDRPRSIIVYKFWILVGAAACNAEKGVVAQRMPVFGACARLLKRSLHANPKDLQLSPQPFKEQRPWYVCNRAVSRGKFKDPSRPHSLKWNARIVRIEVWGTERWRAPSLIWNFERSANI